MRKNIILLILAGILGSLVLLLPSKDKESKKDDKNQPVQLMSVREPELKKLIITQNKKNIVLERNEKTYQIVSSGKEGGNSEIMGFIASLNSLEGYPVAVQLPDNEENKIEAETQGSKLFLKVIGKREIGSPAYYVRNNKGTFLVETEKLDKVLRVSENDLRNHILTDFTSKDIAEFHIDQKRFYQKEEGRWLADGLKEDETDSNKVFSIFATVSSLRIKKFTPSFSMAQYGLLKPLHTVILKLKSGKILKYYFSKVKDSYYCMEQNGKEIYEINDFDWKYFEKDLSALKKDKQDSQPVLPGNDEEEQENEEESE